jgi:hypothetical protein
MVIAPLALLFGATVVLAFTQIPRIRRIAKDFRRMINPDDSKLLAGNFGDQPHSSMRAHATNLAQLGAAGQPMERVRMSKARSCLFGFRVGSLGRRLCGEPRKHRTGWRSGGGFEPRAPSISPSSTVVSIRQVMNCSRFLL